MSLEDHLDTGLRPASQDAGLFLAASMHPSPTTTLSAFLAASALWVWEHKFLEKWKTAYLHLQNPRYIRGHEQATAQEDLQKAFRLTKRLVVDLYQSQEKPCRTRGAFFIGPSTVSKAQVLSHGHPSAGIRPDADAANGCDRAVGDRAACSEFARSREDN